MRPPFAYHRPATVEEACRILAREPGAAVLAGGTDLMVHLRQSWRGQRPPAVVNVKRIPGLDAIAVADGAIRLGALASLTALIEHPVIRAEYPVLSATARYMGSPAIRNLASVGGNLCNASPAADLPPVLLALDAEVGIAGPGGARRLPLERFFHGPGQTVLQPGELLVWVEFPRRRPPWPIRYERLDVRRAMDIAIAGAALAVCRDGGPRDARVALCAVAPTPIRVREAEAVLATEGLTDAAIAQAAELASAAARPISDVRATAGYRREMVGVLVRRGLEALRDA
ncbi:MAG: xanthine dehydrogenase family protein subunit M [Candidatus Rokubacteria bacterium]|nr:xanthine dehydrogenase family protein subunit M [Candidatus Rokubacteria bacterium]